MVVGPLLSSILIAASVCVAAAAEPPVGGGEPSPFAADGAAVEDAVGRAFRLPTSRQYAQAVYPSNPTSRPAGADAWTVGVQLSALAAAARVDPAKYTAELRWYADAMTTEYWSDFQGIGGYDGGAHPAPPDRYYDDNAWMCLGLLEAYDVTADPAYLDRAKLTLAFVFSGESDALGGGLFWRETPRASKNTCTNAPAIVAAVRTYSFTHDPKTLDAAVRVYKWTAATLRDPGDHLYYDNLNLAGKIGRFKWTYNSALMIRAGCELYTATGDVRYLRDAQATAAAAKARWCRPSDGAIRDRARFAHLLAEAFLELSARDGDPQWAEADRRAVEYVWDHGRDANGWFGDSWSEPATRPSDPALLIDQASAARALFRAAWPMPTSRPAR